MIQRSETLQGTRIRISGIVQGVGFRPFVFTLATSLGLRGWVRNTSAGVEIEVDGAPDQIDRFVHKLRDDAPPLARIDAIDWEARPANGYESFEILDSQAIPDAFQPISPDVSICPDCLRELFDPHDRRYLYPFINCTNCGPRFTIIQDIPYDRSQTTMSGFAMCPECAREYRDPLDRRFHAQPVACPRCGPRVWLEAEWIGEGEIQENPVRVAQDLLKDGKILAIKGLGGFHLACDATNHEAVIALRERKLRVDKPFALMMPDITTVQSHCFVSPAERALLESVARPIVILRRRPGSAVARQVAPEQDTIGVMLPYTPLHYLLFTPTGPGAATKPGANGPREEQPVRPALEALVMTSGNLSEEPIAYDNQDARERLSALADAFLMHNRPIYTRCDDSVMRVFAAGTAAPLTDQPRADRESPPRADECLMPIRRSRGYAPFPVLLPHSVPPILAAGGELKNTFCITHERYAFLSHHIGDLENFETLSSFEEAVRHFERLFRSHPVALAHDLHPDYLATRYVLDRAEAEGLPAFGVQHHHAHIAACLAENGQDDSHPVIGISFDGTGYGEDGAIWGGEFLIASYGGYKRAAHLRYIPLLGGDRAVKEPWRIALAWLVVAGLDGDETLPPVQYALSRSTPHLDVLGALRHQVQTGLNSPHTSSMGRLFDAAAALIGIRQTVNYEAQAAIELQALADSTLASSHDFDFKDAYPLELITQEPGFESQGLEVAAPLILDPLPLFLAIAKDHSAGVSPARMAARFHKGIALATRDVAMAMRKTTGLNQIALSGGVWQNTALLALVLRLLRQAGFEVLVHSKVPCNDGGLALGQAVIAARSLDFYSLSS